MAQLGPICGGVGFISGGFAEGLQEADGVGLFCCGDGSVEDFEPQGLDAG